MNLLFDSAGGKRFERRAGPGGARMIGVLAAGLVALHVTSGAFSSTDEGLGAGLKREQRELAINCRKAIIESAPVADLYFEVAVYSTMQDGAPAVALHVGPIEDPHRYFVACVFRGMRGPALRSEPPLPSR